MLRTKIASTVCAAALFGTAATGAIAHEPRNNQQGGAVGLVAAVANVATDDVVSVEVVDSLNNINALNNVLNNANVLNNSPILSGNDVDVTVGDVSLLSDFLNDNNVTLDDFLNDLDLDVEDVVAVGALETGDLIIFV